MNRSSSSSSLNEEQSRKSSHTEDHHLQSKRNFEDIDKRRQAWLIQQEREREHEIRKQKMILEYELKRAAMLSSKKEYSSERSSPRRRNRSRSQDHQSTNDSKVAIMSQKLDATDRSTPLFKGGSRIKISAADLPSIKINIHRNIPGTSVVPCEPQRDTINPEEITLKRREDEGVKPIFDREELKLPQKTTNEEVEEHRTVQMIDSERLGKTNHSPRRFSRCVSSSRKYRQSSSEDSSTDGSSRNKRSGYKVKSNHRRNCSNERYKSDSRDQSRGYERRHRSEDSPKRKSSQERTYSRERKRNSDHQRSSQSDRNRYREYRGRSREHGKRERSLENRERERPRDRRMPTRPLYVEEIPIPIYYGNYPPRPIMGPMMPVGGPWPRNNFPIGPRMPFPPRFMHPQMYRPGLPSNPRFNRMF